MANNLYLTAALLGLVGLTNLTSCDSPKSLNPQQTQTVSTNTRDLEQKCTNLQSQNTELNKNYQELEREKRIDEIGKYAYEKKSRLLEQKLELVYETLEPDNQNPYSAEEFLQILKLNQMQILDSKKLQEKWKELTDKEKRTFYLAYLDSDLFYNSFDKEKKQEYEEFLKDEKSKMVTIAEIANEIGLVSENNLDPKNPLNLVLFQTLYDFDIGF